MSRQATVILTLLFAGASLGLYQIKYKIQSLKQDFAGIQDEVWIEHDSVHLL